jgi:archaemetzincin
MKYSALKDIVYIGLMVLAIGGTNEYLQKYDYSYDKVMASIGSEAKRLDKVYGYDKNYSKEDVVEVTPDVEQPSSTEVTSDRVIYIHGFGNYTQSDLYVIKEGVENFYGIRCVISKSIESGDFYYNNSTNVLLAYKVLTLSVGKSDMNMYVTDEPLCEENSDNLISGHARINCDGSVISTKEMRNNNHYNNNSLVHTAVHELGHNFGLSHCNNQSCIMKSHGLDTKEFCDECKSKINKH